MRGFAVLVDFRLNDGQRDAFRALVDANARTSVQEEKGCHRFDVLEPDGEPESILLYEIYDDRDAFQFHLATAHYRAFDQASAALVARKTVVACDLVFEGSVRT